MFHSTNPQVMKPQLREAIGWLVCERPDYVTISQDRDADPPTLKGGDPKASGLCLFRNCIIELRELE